MPRGEKDHGTNWLIQNQAGALVRLLGLTPRTCRTVHPRLTLPQAIPDGLLELTLPDHDRPVPLLLEIETYPSAETNEQLSRDLDLAALALGKLPDAAVIVLCRRGKNQAAGRTQQSLLGWSQRKHRWRVLELWKVSAEELLGMNEVGLLPLLPLTRSRESPELLFRQSWERIDQQGRSDQRVQLLTITSILAGLRYTEATGWIETLGGKSMLAESSVYQKWMAEKECETKQVDIVFILEERFGDVPEAIAVQVRSITDPEKLKEWMRHSLHCKSIADFRKRIGP
jgi:hypothetical protein